MLDNSRTFALGVRSIKKRLGENIVRVARRVGFLHSYSSLRSRLVKQQIAIMMYHRIDRVTNYPWSLVPITPENFDREMKYLSQRYQIISLDELCNALSGLKTLPSNAAVVTIDDGYRDVYTHAYPILKKYNVPATVFLATGHVGTGKLFWWDKVGYVIWKTKLNTLELGELGTYHLTSADERRWVADTITKKLKIFPLNTRDELIKRLVRSTGVDIPSNLGEELILSWDEIKEMSKNSVSFGAHTVNHPILSRLSIETARKEIVDSKRHIEKELGQEVTAFCYPDGAFDSFSNDIEEIIKSNGFRCAITTSPGAFVSATTQLYRLPRIIGAASYDTFELLLSGLYSDFVAKWHKPGG